MFPEPAGATTIDNFFIDSVYLNKFDIIPLKMAFLIMIPNC